MQQNNITLLAPYNPQDLPEILFKRCTNIQEIATFAKNLYTTQQLLIKALNLITRCGLNITRYFINHLISTMLSGQCFVFLFCQGTEQPHQGNVNTREAIPNTTKEVRYESS